MTLDDPLVIMGMVYLPVMLAITIAVRRHARVLDRRYGLDRD